jgi:NADP-dependent 3-hydroxy acid dehydrogenase YdfG
LDLLIKMALRRLVDCVSVITGASGGIGRAVALALATEGVALCLTGRNVSRLADVEAQARAAGAGELVSVCGDITEDNDLNTVASTVNDRFGGADMLIHCAGVYRRASFEDASIEDFDALYATNLRAPYRLMQKMLPLLRRRQGDIVLISSTQGLTAGVGVGQYAATHHGLKALADSLRAEINGAGVRVTVLHVGTTATPLQERIHAAAERPYAPERLLQPQDIASIVVAAVSLPRSAEITELTIRSMQKP